VFLIASFGADVTNVNEPPSSICSLPIIAGYMGVFRGGPRGPRTLPQSKIFCTVYKLWRIAWWLWHLCKTWQTLCVSH